MNRRTFLQNSVLSLGALTLTQQKALESLFPQTWKITMLRNDLGIYTDRGGTIGFLLSRDGIVVVDAQFPDQSKNLIEELKKKSQQPFKLLINTHHHGDHTAGNISFKGIVEHVLAHENSKKNQERVARQQKTEDNQLYPDQVYSTVWCQRAGREKICLYYFGPAHTNGDSVIHFQKANIVHLGDLMFNRRHPFVDRSAGASMRGWMEVLDKTMKKFNRKTLYIFGHAAEGHEVTGTADDLKKFRDYLGQVLDFADKEIKAGKTKEEFLKNTTIPGNTEWKGDGIQRPLGAAWDELTTK
jgi:cyclase